MKKILISLLLLPIFCQAEPVRLSKPVLCEDLDKLLPSLININKEKLEWVGLAGKTNYALTINKETLAWSLIEFSFRENIGCFIGAGVGYNTTEQTAPSNSESKPPTKKF